jgi:hypothetical protein
VISVGFFKHVHKWLTNEGTSEILYRPFETDKNPYKANVFIVGSHPTPTLNLEIADLQQYANALVNRKTFNELFPNYLKTTSRDVKASLRLAQSLEEQGLNTVISYVNALAAKNVTELKKYKKENEVQYKRGTEIFKEVLNEIKPPIILLHGTYALDQFRLSLKDYFVEYGHPTRSLAELEDEGVFGKIVYEDGTASQVYAVKSLATYKKDDDQYKQIINRIVNTKTS